MGTLVRICREGEPKALGRTVLLIIIDDKKYACICSSNKCKNITECCWGRSG